MKAVLRENSIDPNKWSRSVGVDNALPLIPIQFFNDL